MTEMNLKFKPNELVVKTGGGLWSSRKTHVEIESIQLCAGYSGKEEEMQLEVVFNPKTWDVNKDGLIYTDEKFCNSLREQLTKLHPEIDWSRLSYTEQGTQDTKYVHIILGDW